MAKCKYPHEVCANMTLYHGVTYCDSVPCSLRDELPEPTNADHIRSMSNDELLEFLISVEIDGIADTTLGVANWLCATYKPNDQQRDNWSCWLGR